MEDHGCSFAVTNTGVCLIPKMKAIRYQSPADNLRLGQQSGGDKSQELAKC